MQLIPIQNILSNQDSFRKAGKTFLPQKGITIDSDSVNIHKETHCSLLLCYFTIYLTLRVSGIKKICYFIAAEIWYTFKKSCYHVSVSAFILNISSFYMWSQLDH